MFLFVFVALVGYFNVISSSHLVVGQLDMGNDTSRMA